MQGSPARSVFSLIASPSSITLLKLVKWKATTHLDVIDAIKPCLSDLRQLADVYIQWVPGHAGVVGNEIADFLAKRGVNGTSSTASPPDSFLLPLLSPSAPVPPLPAPLQHGSHTSRLDVGHP